MGSLFARNKLNKVTRGMDQLDLNVLSLARQQGQDLPELPGLYIPAQPRRPARGRQPDRLILYMVIAGNAPLVPDQQNQLLIRLAETYYKTPGSSTAAQRAVAEALNDYLLDRNLKAASSGRQAIGLLAIITVRNNHLYLAQCGPTHGYLINAAGAEHLYDPQSPGRGLGLGRTTSIYYSQAELRANDTLLLSAEPPAAWSAQTLSGLHNQGPESLRRYLLSQAGQDLRAVLIQAKTGAGKIFMLRPKSAQPASPVRPLAQAPAPEAEMPLPEVQAAILETPEVTATQPPVSSIEQLARDYPRAPTVEQAIPPSASEFAVPTSAEMPPASALPRPPVTDRSTVSVSARARRRSQVATPIASGLASAGSASQAAADRVGHGFRSLLLRMLPGEGLMQLPSATMFIVAIAVPLVVVAIASVVYFQRGRAGQYQAYLAQAVQAAGYARSQTDPNTRMQSWQTVINYVEQAEQYQVTSDTQALRQEASLVSDELNSVRRLDYQPAIVNGLADNANISHMVATETDLYLLNSEGGSVIRALATGTGYDVDSTFQCASGLPTGQTGQLVDIAAAPKGNTFNATVQAMDINGNLLQCSPGKAPEFSALAPPSKGWGKPQAFTINLGNLFILDQEKKTVWIYWDSQYTSPPEEFFVAEFPMENVVDLAVDKTDLYLLHADGHTTYCGYSEMSVSPSRCTDFLPYIDSRPGRESQMMTFESPFGELLSTQPPDPSLYYLQPDSHALYRFSLRLLTYYGQLLPRQGSTATTGIATRPATAFTLTPDARLAFLAVGNRVFYAGTP